MEFRLWAQGEYLHYRHFLKNILFTFRTNEVVPSQNKRYRVTENPNWAIKYKRQYFLQFSMKKSSKAIHELTFALTRNLYLQLDDCSLYNIVIVSNWLCQNYSNRWIERRTRSIGWSPRPPDLTPLDFFYGFILKYNSRARNQVELSAFS